MLFATRDDTHTVTSSSMERDREQNVRSEKEYHGNRAWKKEIDWLRRNRKSVLPDRTWWTWRLLILTLCQSYMCIHVLTRDNAVCRCIFSPRRGISFTENERSKTWKFPPRRSSAGLTCYRFFFFSFSFVGDKRSYKIVAISRISDRSLDERIRDESFTRKHGRGRFQD